MIDTNKIERPGTLREVAEWSDSIKEFGQNLRDWQHEIQRGSVHSRGELARRLKDAPPVLADQFDDGDIADGYLAAYAEWIADGASIERPRWCRDVRRASRKPWFATALHGHLLATAPASFRHRNIYAIPEPVFRPRRGRPPVPEEQKREKARLRQKAYRKRVSSVLKKARAAGITAES